MKRFFITACCAIMTLVTFAQSETHVLDFVRNCPWELTDTQIQEKYRDNIFILPDSISQLLNSSLPVSSNVISGIKFNDYNTFIGYAIDIETKKPSFFTCIFDPTQTPNKDFLTEIQTTISRNFGEPMELPDEAKNKQEYANGVASRFVNAWNGQNAMIIFAVFDYPYIDGNNTQQTITMNALIIAPPEEEEETNLEEYRVKFRGIPINGSASTFCSELSKLGYTKYPGFTPTDQVVAAYSGTYGGKECTLYIYVTPTSKTVYQVRVIVGESKSWSIVKNTYFSFKNRFESKYGEPWASEEKFEYPYEDGCGYELTCFARNKATFTTSFNNTYEIGIGFIDISIMSSTYGSSGWVAIDFRDGQNMLLNESELSSSL